MWWGLFIQKAGAIVSALFWRRKIKEEKKTADKNYICTRPPKILIAFFLGLAMLFTCCGIVIAIVAKLNTKELALVLSVFFVLAAIGFFGYLFVRFNYVVINGNDIIVHRLFLKCKRCSFDKIAFFRDDTYLGVRGELVCYDKEKKKMFSVAAIHVGVSFIIQRLKEQKVVQI